MSGHVRHSSSSSLGLILSLLVGLGATASAAAQMSVLINPGDQNEGAATSVFSAWKGGVEAALRQTGQGASKVSFSTNTQQDLSATRAQLFDVFVGPAPLIGSAVRYGYTPLITTGKPARVALVVLDGSAITSFQQTRQARLGMPGADSVVTYLLRGEVRATNTTLKQHFKSIYDTRFQGALLPCLELRQCDVVAVEQSVAQEWLASGKRIRVIWQSRDVPGETLAVRTNSQLAAEQLRKALAGALSGSGYSTAIATKDFEYVSTLGYFTPRTIDGANLLEDSNTLKKLLASGARYIDTRNQAEFDEGHVPGAELVPYGEKSVKDPGYDPAQDKFDVARLGPNKAQLLVFGCNGPECWKSFKASRAAVKAGYTQVYWFRGGFPLWRDAGNQVARRPSPA